MCASKFFPTSKAAAALPKSKFTSFVVPSTVVVIPCFNEASRLNADAFRRALDTQPNLRFVMVNDGSTDRTLEVITNFASNFPDRVFVLNLEHNQGKAEAVRRGVLRAAELDPDLIGYWDADLATPLDAIGQFVAALDGSNLLLAMGARVRMLGRKIDRSAVRHVIGRCFATLASHILDLPVYDTQCGAKLFRWNPVMQRVFDRAFQLNWCFDVEILARLRGLESQGLCDVRRQCVEVALDVWIDAAGSKLGARQVPQVLAEFARLRTIVRGETAR
jgi:dolichyl-phosphate beta-glucosyltransferase